MAIHRCFQFARMNMKLFFEVERHMLDSVLKYLLTRGAQGLQCSFA